jgi:SAM-dependent methyltransferase
MLHTSHDCRACGTTLPPPFLDLGFQPLSNAFLDPDRITTEQRYPLRVRLCRQCALVQADDAVPPTAIFDADYAYFSSFSDSWLAQSRRFAEAAIVRFALNSNSRVVEIASNDGYLLQYFAAAGVSVLGIEPTANTAAVAVARGVPTEIAFFNEATGRRLAERGLTADVLYGANVLAHVPDLRDFLGGIPHVLKPGGTLVFEFPHLFELIGHMQFDTIYHEHFSYLSLLAVERALATHGLAVYDLDRLPTHGGSLRLYCGYSADRRMPSDAVQAVRGAERAAALDDPATFAAFAARIAGIRDVFMRFVARTQAEGRRIAAYGAAAKGNTFLNTCGVTATDIVCTFDRNPHKQGKLLPGSHIPVLAPEMIDTVRPDFVLILPWNLRTEIHTQLAGIAEWGGRFVIAVPELEIFAP